MNGKKEGKWGEEIGRGSEKGGLDGWRDESTYIRKKVSM